MRLMKPGFSALAWVSMRPDSTATPAASSRANPLPATKGFGSTIAATTRVTPAASRASVQGGVRP